MVLKKDMLDLMLVYFLKEHNDTYRGICWLVVTDLTTGPGFELYYCCLLSYRYTLALLRFMLFNLQSDML